MFRRIEKAGQPIVGIEICHADVHLAVGRRQEVGTLGFHTQSLTWRDQATTLHCDAGQRELGATLKQLVLQHKLQGATIYLALSGAFCVTRVVTGTTERVRHELSQLEQRSALYLSLGHGRKAVGGSVREIDARHQHALLTVVNERTLDALINVCRQAGLRLKLVEPSLVSICRVVGHMGGDTDSPALIINLGEQAAELGITYGGRPLLDYRLASVQSHQQVASVVIDHLSRLERYRERYVRVAKGKLDVAFLCGQWQAVDVAGAALEEHANLTVQALDPPTIDARWKFEGDVPGSEMSPALGCCLLAMNPSEREAGPNLLEGLQAQPQMPMLPALAATFWPVAAALVVATCAWSFVLSQQRGCRQLESQLVSFEPAQQTVRSLRRRIARDQQKIAHLTAIQAALPRASWHDLAQQIGQCLPEDVWLDSLSVEPGGKLILSGASFTDDGVFELVRWLRQHPRLHDVALQGTQATRLKSGPATRFDVFCAIAAGDGHEVRHDDDG